MPIEKLPRFFSGFGNPDGIQHPLRVFGWIVGFFVSIFKVWGFKEWLRFFLKEMFVLKSLVQNYGILRC